MKSETMASNISKLKLRPMKVYTHHLNQTPFFEPEKDRSSSITRSNARRSKLLRYGELAERDSVIISPRLKDQKRVKSAYKTSKPSQRDKPSRLSLRQQAIVERSKEVAKEKVRYSSNNIMPTTAFIRDSYANVEDLDRRLTKLDEMLAASPEEVMQKSFDKRAPQQTKIIEKQRATEKAASGTLRLHYLRKLKHSNRSSRFNEDFSQRPSEVTSKTSRLTRSAVYRPHAMAAPSSHQTTTRLTSEQLSKLTSSKRMNVRSSVDESSIKTGSIKIDNLLKEYDQNSKTSLATSLDKDGEEARLRLLIYHKILEMTPQ